MARIEKPSYETRVAILQALTVEEGAGRGKWAQLVVAIAPDLAHHVWHERKEVVQLA